MSQLCLHAMSDTSTALLRVEQYINSPYPLEKILSHISGKTQEVLEILGDSTNRYDDGSFGSGVTILPNTKITLESLKQTGISIQQTELFTHCLEGYSFSHGYLQDDSTFYTIGSMLLDNSVLGYTQKNLTKEDFLILEESLHTIFALSNHDYTIHGLGFVTKYYNDTIIRSYLEQYMDFSQISYGVVDTPEILAAMFHKDIIQNLQEIGIPIDQYTFTSVEKYMGVISKITRKDIQKYWLYVMTYPLFSIISHNNPDFLKLMDNFEDIDITPTRWSRALAQETIPTSLSKEGLSVRLLRQAVVKDLVSRDNSIPNVKSTVG